MKLNKLMGLMITALLLAGLAVAQPPQAKKHSWTGVVTDSMCGAKHMMADAAECTRACVNKGSSYALLVGDTVYTLKGHESEVDKLAGQKATVTGTAEGTTIQVASVKGS
jgi:hypothetical protein